MNLDAAVSDSISIARASAARREDYQRAACVLAGEVERLRAELAEAKAASVCPVEVIDCYFNAMPDLGDVRFICKSGADAQAVTDWLRERMKERGE